MAFFLQNVKLVNWAGIVQNVMMISTSGVLELIRITYFGKE